jgi:hypothetical protein
MQIKVGTHRVVFIANRYVVKIPRLLRPFRFIKDTVKILNRERWGKFHNLRMAWINSKVFFKTFWYGVEENWEEYQAWKTENADFLVPTIFTIAGLLNVQRRSMGKPISHEEVVAIWSSFAKATKKELWKTNYHTLASELNYHRMDDGTLKLLDYGGVRKFIQKWRGLFENVLITNSRSIHRP